ncbi:MAG TPA: FAD-binding oxidoreductase [Planctomycetaceae bacterium]|nr:FAD-binding oxidoreductase [Planctomycetaceae bacterium]
MPARSENPDEFLPATQPELCRWVGENSAGAARPIYPAGGRTALHFGYPVRQPGITLSTIDLKRVIDYPARDMTITVEAGIRISELADILAGERQRLPIDVPLARRATLGGVVSTNASGSRRFGLGTMRDYVIGLSAVDASGRLFKSGGRVVKNVAGYDLCKMLVGSFGTLAVVTQLTLKLRPIPESSRLLWCAFDHLSAVELVLARLTTSATRPVALDLLDARAAATIASEADLDLPTNRPVLCVGLEGTERETVWQMESLQTEIQPFSPHSMTAIAGADAESVWSALTEFQIGSDDPLTFKASLLPSRTVEFVQRSEAIGCALQAHAGNGIVHGHLPDTVTSASAARAALEPLREMVRQCRGNLVIERCDDAWKQELPIFGDPDPSWSWMRRLKQQLDPRGLLNPQRLLGPLS